MHSSRIGIARLLTVSQHALLGDVPARGVYLPGGTCQGGCTCPGRGTCPEGVPTQGGVPAQGVYLPRGVPAWGGTCPGTRPL